MQPSTSQASQLTGHNSLRGAAPHKKSQPKFATAVAQPPTGAVATSSSTHSSLQSITVHEPSSAVA